MNRKSTCRHPKGKIAMGSQLVRISNDLMGVVRNIGARRGITPPRALHRSIELHSFVAGKIDEGMEFAYFNPADQTYTKVDLSKY